MTLNSPIECCTDMTLDQIKYQKIRDCFYAGYSLPMWCHDRGIKHPLVLSYDPLFLWEIRTQFSFCKIYGLYADFMLMNNPHHVDFSDYCIQGGVTFETFDSGTTDFGRYDAVLIFTTNLQNIPPEKCYYFDKILEDVQRIVYVDCPLNEYLSKHPGVKILVTNAPELNLNEYSTSDEKKLREVSFEDIKQAINENRSINTAFDKLGYTKEQIRELLNYPVTYLKENGCSEFIETGGELKKLLPDGRETANNPEEYKNTIYCLGTCTFIGLGAPWDKTIESYLQAKCVMYKNPYRVVNKSQFYAGRYQDIYYQLNELDVVDGDIIIICIQNIKCSNLPFLDLYHTFDRPHSYGEVFFDSWHVHEKGYKILAEKIYNYLIETRFLDTIYPLPQKQYLHPHSFGIPSWVNKNNPSPNDSGLEQYLNHLKGSRRSIFGRIGCIVMNCNPFTLGHRQLVEYAASKVRHLIVFVVEEDLSIFPFKDRMMLVEKGLQDLKNVSVMPSGTYIISKLTFSGYFNKANLQNQIVDCSYDVEIFASKIAPELGITVRFVGEELLDTVTRQYNESMKKILPKYGITLEELPRFYADNEPISASKVRKLFMDKKWDDLRKLVPDCTYAYLVDHEESIQKRISLQ